MSKWDPGQHVVDELCALVAAGSSVRCAARALGLSEYTAWRCVRERGVSTRSYVRLTKTQEQDIAARWRTGMAPMDIVRQTGVGSSQVYRIGIELGLWHRNPHGRRAKATTLQCAYLQLRVGALGRRDAAAATGISERTCLDIDKGLIKSPGVGRIPFVPDGPDTFLYKRLMQLLEYVDGRVSVPVQVIEQERIDRRISLRYLSIEEREQIFDLRNKGWGVRRIARHVNRSPGTISKELRRNSDDFGLYTATGAHRKSVLRRFRPKVRKVDANRQLRQVVWDMLRQRLSPEQIAGRLRKDYPEDQTMWVCAETIYQTLFFQAKGELKKGIAGALRQGRAVRRTQGTRANRPRFVDPMVMISQRPAAVEDRAVPGHWEGDLILDKGNKSAIGTLVERQTRYVMLLHLPDGHGAAQVRDRLVEPIGELPQHLRGSLTWDQGSEMAGHLSFSVATDCPVYFCDPASPWQRGTNENTNGLLRQYFPKGTDLSVYSKEDLEYVALELNRRPRKTLGFDTPADRMVRLLESGAEN